MLSLRLPPGADLRGELEAQVAERGIEAAWVVSGIGSLHELVIRPAAARVGLHLAGPWELLGLQGSLGPCGVHLHLSASDGQGFCRGGHLLEGNRIRTTAEIALLLPSGVCFERFLDPSTGWRELGFAPPGGGAWTCAEPDFQAGSAGSAPGRTAPLPPGWQRPLLAS